jgi:hypothetical protein
MAVASSSSVRCALFQLRRAARHLPVAIDVLYDIRPPNRPVTIYRGPFWLARGRSAWRLRGALELTWFPHPTVRFRGRVTSKGFIEHLGDGWTLTVPGEDKFAVSVSSTGLKAASGMFTTKFGSGGLGVFTP